MILLCIMKPEEVSISLPTHTVVADWYAYDPTRPILLVFVGFASNKDRQGEFVRIVAERANLNALVVNLSGQGYSEFEMDQMMPAQHVMEAAAAYDWLMTRYPQQTVYVMGTSYGGFIAAYLTRFRKIKKLVLRTPAIYRPEDFYTVHRDIDKPAAREYRKGSSEVRSHPLFLQPALETPGTLVVVHGSDESVPAETTDAYADEFNATAYTAEGFVHRFSDPSNPKDAIDSYYRTVVDWLAD